MTTPGSNGPDPCSMISPARMRNLAPPLEHSTSATAAMLASASPRKPKDRIAARSEIADSLLVVWRTKAIASSAAGMPAPSSLTRIEVFPAPPAGQAGQGRNVDPVRAVGASRNDTVEETDGLAFLEDLDALVAHARHALRQRSQLVVVRREQRAAPESGRVVKVLDHGLRDGDAVIRRCPPPHLVENDERRPRGVVEDVRRFGHLDHERGHACADVVMCADPREHAVRQPDD